MTAQLDAFQALADPTRRSIIQALRKGERQVNDIVEQAAMELRGRRSIVVQQGNLVHDLRPLLETVPRDAQLVVFHSAVLSYVNRDEQAIFARVLADASRVRDIAWISHEARTVIPEITTLALASGPRPFLLGRATFHGGERHDEFLALAHPHGAELEWFHPIY